MYTKLSVINFHGLPEIQIGFGDEAGFAQFSRINVIAGPNSSGKTSLLKLLYANLKAYSEDKNNLISTKPSLWEQLSSKLLTTFRPKQSGLSELVTKKSGPAKIALTLEGEDGYSLKIAYQVGQDAKFRLSETSHELTGIFEGDCIFIPSKEVLTIFNAISYTREQVQLEDFDDTYYDLVKLLRIPTLSGRTLNEIKDVNAKLEDLFEGKIEQEIENGTTSFVYKVGNQRFAMQQTAEGIKKIGILTTLINNRKLGRNTILFLDEPETALNPTAQRQLVRILNQISKVSGVQIFLATHSYYIISQLYNITLEENRSSTCISLSKDDKGVKSVSFHNLIDGIPDIPIIREAIDLHSEANKLKFAKIKL